MVEGRIHSVESCGTVDGPGIRYVIFTQGCAFDCKYCHNPDTWDRNGGEVRRSTELFQEVYRLRKYLQRSGGGVTCSGGEPLNQPKFVAEIFRMCREKGIHTALDTTGAFLNDAVKQVLKNTDLVLLDMKCVDPERQETISRVDIGKVNDFVQYLQQENIPFWLRYVLVPGLTDDEDLLVRSAQYVSTFSNLERVEILPYHRLGEFKWESMGKEYPLGDTPEPSIEDVIKASKIFSEFGMSVYPKYLAH
jgi:pyruvate formate lyase activating enzyme